MVRRLHIALLIISSLFSIEIYSQSIPLGLSIFDEYYRRAQLLGEISPASSFASRPIFRESLPDKDIFDPDSILFFNRKANFDGKWKFGKEKGLVMLLPLSVLNQFNSHHPEGFNDGSMIPAKGLQTQIRAGVFAKYGHLSIQFRPEFVYAQNKEFDIMPNSPTPGSDLPQRFGTNPYSKAFWGQTSIRVSSFGVSFGLSNENLWWGPGYRNSLLMTNSAPGFVHLTLNTVKPVKTYIGSFEGQIIAGRLKESGFTGEISEDWRYINGMVMTYNPKWIPGLFLGATRSFIVLKSDMAKGFLAYLPVFSFISKKAGGTGGEVDAMGQNQLISLFMRWLFKEAHGEIYFEWGREDHAYDLRDFIQEPASSVAYLLGFSKLFSINRQKETYMQLIVESTHLASSLTYINRSHGSAYNWYTHGPIGYTNNGEVLGAGIGPGGNLQTLDLSWVRSFKQIGIRLERYIHNDDYWYNNVRDIRANWVDLSTTAYANWDFKNLILSVKLKYIQSKNYQWLYEPQTTEELEFWAPSKDTPNFHAQLGVIYRF